MLQHHQVASMTMALVGADENLQQVSYFHTIGKSEIKVLSHERGSSLRASAFTEMQFRLLLLLFHIIILNPGINI